VRDLAHDQADVVPASLLRVHAPEAWHVVERFPFVIPVIFEAMEQRRSIPALWDAIHDRLGEQAWAYLPTGAPRLGPNGKTYVREAFTLLNTALLFRQNVVRYEPLRAVTTTLYLRVAGADLDATVQAFAAHAPTLDAYPISETEVFLRVTCTHAVLQRILSSVSTIPLIAESYFVDSLRNDREPLRVRFAYEELFDPATSQWRFPTDLLDRLSR
jgi:hypothetical protein